MVERLMILARGATPEDAQARLQAAGGRVLARYGDRVWVADVTPEADATIAGRRSACRAYSRARSPIPAGVDDDAGRMGIAAWNLRQTASFRAARSARLGEGRVVGRRGVRTRGLTAPPRRQGGRRPPRRATRPRRYEAPVPTRCQGAPRWLAFTRIAGCPPSPPSRRNCSISVIRSSPDGRRCSSTIASSRSTYDARGLLERGRRVEPARELLGSSSSWPLSSLNARGGVRPRAAGRRTAGRVRARRRSAGPGRSSRPRGCPASAARISRTLRGPRGTRRSPVGPGWTSPRRRPGREAVPRIGTDRVWGTAAGIAPMLIHSTTPSVRASSTSRRRGAASGSRARGRR